jgi:hypothetical protein
MMTNFNLLELHGQIIDVHLAKSGRDVGSF